MQGKCVKGIKAADVCMTTSMTITATVFILFSLYVAVGQQQGADLEKSSGQWAE